MPVPFLSRIFDVFKSSDAQDKKPQYIIDVNNPTEDFRPEFYDLCYCGSEKLFSECCGSIDTDRPPPHGLFIFENYVDADFVKELCDFANKQEGHRLTVINSAKSTPNHIVKNEDDRRVAERIDLGDRRQEINTRVKTIFTELAMQCYGKKLEWLESPDLMRYREGGYYKRHADSQNMSAGNKTWSKVIDRDISMLIYLNDDFEGGELSFEKMNYRIRPSAGLVVLFPSDQRFIHQAETVLKGVRYAIVSWASIVGMPKIADKPPESAIFVE